jgi:hypothetical protein
MHAPIKARRRAQAPATRSMPTSLSTAEHLTMLKRAIDANLTARIEHGQRGQKATTGAMPELINMTDLLAASDDWLLYDEIITDPIRRALRVQLNMLGQRLFDLVGSTNRMRAIAEEVAEQKPRLWGKCIDIIDKAWDGVGNNKDRWIC